MSNQIKLLIFNPSPRQIPLFETKIKLLNKKYDIYRIKFNWDEQGAYEEGRQFFLSHPEYTHFAILPDDLLMDVHHVDKLVSDLENNPGMEVLSGICNFSLVNKKFYNTLAVIPHDRIQAYSMFKQLAKYQYDSLLNRDTYHAGKKGVQRVLFAAFSFTIINRRVLELFGFKPIKPSGQIIEGMGLDTLFYNNCYRSNIQCWADFDVMLLHIKDIEFNNDLTWYIQYAYDNNVKTGLVKSPSFKQENVLLKAGSISS
jgi:hypothetical protein